MVMITTVFIITVLVITIGIFGTWLYFLIYMLKSFKESPTLRHFEEPSNRAFPLISVIVPARNEEAYITKCLDGLVKQNYPNFEIVLVDDSSEDGTWEIMQKYSTRYKERITSLQAGVKPGGWVGKNWACYRGYLRCKGQLLLFTDADTDHNPLAMKLAEQNLRRYNADAVTVIPKLLCKEMWTKIILPMLSIFLHTRFSCLRVNNPRTKIGYFFGSFYLITRSSYEAIGTHKIVRQELVEDGALGAELKNKKFLIRMVRGESFITAFWARDLDTLWHGMRRLVIPLYSRNKTATILMSVAVVFLLLEPFVLLPFSIWLAVFHTELSFVYGQANIFHLLALFLTTTNILTILLIFASNGIQSNLGVFQSPFYALCCPLAALVISACFASCLIDARKDGEVNWRGRHYNMKDYAKPLQ
jgi:chlorobactene glucosyltransferase